MSVVLKPEDFHTQRNNKYDPMNTCGNTTLANLIEASGDWYYKIDGQQLEDTIYEVLRNNICRKYCFDHFPGYTENPETVAAMLAFVGTHITGKPYRYAGNKNNFSIEHILQTGQAVGILGTFYKGGLHYVAVIDFDESNFYIADPF